MISARRILIVLTLKNAINGLLLSISSEIGILMYPIFAEMLSRTCAKQVDLPDAEVRRFGVVTFFAKQEPENVRSLFRSLCEESLSSKGNCNWHAERREIQVQNLGHSF